jgi:hypothetical protein
MLIPDRNTLTASPAVDQMMEAINEARRLAPDNRHLVEDPWIEKCVLFAVSGQTTLDDEARQFFEQESHIEVEREAPRPLVVRGDWFREDVRLHSSEVPDGGPAIKRITAKCSSCDSSAMAGYGVLWLNVGRLILEFVFCHQCAPHFQQTYGPLVWKQFWRA